MISPTIVVLAHKRAESLRRLLGSLLRGSYGDHNVSLIISVDHGADPDVVCLANSMEWPFGPREVVIREERLGLRDHVYACGRFLERMGSMIMLEDDLMVAPGFYDLACQMVRAYQGDDRIASMALYHHAFNETSKMRFWPISDGYDGYFLQVAASWGQCWTAEQWERFSRWSEDQTHESVESKGIPWDMRKWPWSSWKKWYTAFLVDTGRYVVYPRISTTTNFMELGENHRESDATYQRELLVGGREWNLPLLDQSLSRYDAYCEIEPTVLKRLVPELAMFDLTVDLSGMKPVSEVGSSHLISIKPCCNPILGYGRRLRPSEWNAIAGISGTEISVGRREDFEMLPERSLDCDINYHYGVPCKLLGRMFLQRIESKPFGALLRMLYKAFRVWRDKPLPSTKNGKISG
ncbi:MAG: hypothetical protein JW706_04800 [Opitutales bacterium]|nr:hypothetical protein [Opitutales bacterium]